MQNGIVVREMKVKVKTRCNFSPLRVEKWKGDITFSAGKDVGTGTFLHGWQEWGFLQPFYKGIGQKLLKCLQIRNVQTFGQQVYLCESIL